MDTRIVACVPVLFDPELPKHSTYSTYEQVACPRCTLPMWLGAKSKQAVAEGCEMLCIPCLLLITKATGADLEDFNVIQLNES